MALVMHTYSQMSLSNPRDVNKDPICGAEVDQEKALRAESEGVVYYFCGETCRQQFLSVPANDELARGQETR